MVKRFTTATQGLLVRALLAAPVKIRLFVRPPGHDCSRKKMQCSNFAIIWVGHSNAHSQFLKTR